MTVDNSHHLVAAARRRHGDEHQRAQETIRAAHAAGKRVSVSALAAQAGVSRAFLYAHPDLADAARHVASQAPPAPGLTRVERSSEASLRTKLDALSQRNKELRQENSDLRRRLEMAHGQLRTATPRQGGTPAPSPPACTSSG